MHRFSKSSSISIPLYFYSNSSSPTSLLLPKSYSSSRVQLRGQLLQDPFPDDLFTRHSSPTFMPPSFHPTSSRPHDNYFNPSLLVQLPTLLPHGKDLPPHSENRDLRARSSKCGGFFQCNHFQGSSIIKTSKQANI